MRRGLRWVLAACLQRAWHRRLERLSRSRGRHKCRRPVISLAPAAALELGSRHPGAAALCTIVGAGTPVRGLRRKHLPRQVMPRAPHLPRACMPLHASPRCCAWWPPAGAAARSRHLGQAAEGRHNLLRSRRFQVRDGLHGAALPAIAGREPRGSRPRRAGKVFGAARCGLRGRPLGRAQVAKALLQRLSLEKQGGHLLEETTLAERGLSEALPKALLLISRGHAFPFYLGAEDHPLKVEHLLLLVHPAQQPGSLLLETPQPLLVCLPRSVQCGPLHLEALLDSSPLLLLLLQQGAVALSYRRFRCSVAHGLRCFRRGLQ
mmetsp:Transcript_81511/g.264073  ORF Transcript_81511/g.264073 Transcript_81511/m.264073 type:complete len:320 (+) Transcript_81511:380-1339(+)